MITLTFQLVFQNKAKMTHQEVTNYIIEHFPLILGKDRKEGMIISVDGPTEEGEVILKLNQDKLTEDQEMWQTTDDIARQYINMCKVTSNKTKPTHQHTYSVTAGPVTVRYCTACPASWVLNDSHGWHWVLVAENNAVETIDADNLREHVYSAESQVQRAIDALAPIHHDSVLRQVMIDLNTAMDAILDIREMLPGQEA